MGHSDEIFVLDQRLFFRFYIIIHCNIIYRERIHYTVFVHHHDILILLWNKNQVGVGSSLLGWRCNYII